MEGNCPRCQTRLEFPVSGAYRCERCQAQFEVALGAPRAPAPAAVPAVMPGLLIPPPPVPAEVPPVVGSPSPSYGNASINPAMGWNEPPPALGLQAPCAGHPENPAAQVCERCGDFMCRLCATVAEGRAYCPKCFDLLYHRGALGFTHRQFTLPGITLSLGLGAFLTSGCILISLPLAVTGLITGFRALKEHRTRPDLPKRGMTLTGLWFSGISAVLTLIALAAMILGIIRSP